MIFNKETENPDSPKYSSQHSQYEYFLNTTYWISLEESKQIYNELATSCLRGILQYPEGLTAHINHIVYIMTGNQDAEAIPLFCLWLMSLTHSSNSAFSGPVWNQPAKGIYTWMWHLGTWFRKGLWQYYGRFMIGLDDHEGLFHLNESMI